jgi:hypothetical protein
MTNVAANPLFHVSLGDRDEWVVEAEWPDGTLERVSTFKNHSAAAHWIATASEAWLHAPEDPKDLHGAKTSAASR